MCGFILSSELDCFSALETFLKNTMHLFMPLFPASLSIKRGRKSLGAKFVTPGRFPCFFLHVQTSTSAM